MSAASSAVALGKMPGSVKLVLSRERTTNTKSTPPITGIKTVKCSTRNGQLLGGNTVLLNTAKKNKARHSQSHWTWCVYDLYKVSKTRTFQVTHSNAKKRPQVTTMRPSVRGRTPFCLARMSLPSQKNLFFPGNTSHFLRGRCAFFSVWFCADSGDTESACGSICRYSQFFITSNEADTKLKALKIYF